MLNKSNQHPDVPPDCATAVAVDLVQQQEQLAERNRKIIEEREARVRAQVGISNGERQMTWWCI
jgi:hypothetical protein